MSDIDFKNNGRPLRGAGNFFGRRAGKTLSPQQKAVFSQVREDIRLDIAVPPPASLAALFAPPGSAECAERCPRLVLEIGFGGGEHLVAAAAREPATCFFGAEAFVNSIAKACVAIGELGLSNIAIFDDDAVKLLDWLPDASLDRIDLFYPDPWRKRRHWKRRFVNAANLDRMARVLKPGGTFRFASDWEHYVNWTLEQIANHPDFAWTATRATDWKTPFEGWVRTRYEGKAIREGRTPAYLVFRRLITDAR